jgi:IS5 family transposase
LVFNKELTMDGELFRRLYHRLYSDPTLTSTRDCTFPDALILLIYFFAAINNCSPMWASNKRNWPLWCRHLVFPSYSQLMRRLNWQRTQKLVEQLNAEFRAQLPATSQKACDGKPLVVSGFSKDPDARAGRIPDGWGRGYKLHAIVDSLGAIDVFCVTPLDGGEATVMRNLVQKVDLSGAIVRGDANYDSNRLYRAVADAGGRLIAPRRKPFTKLGHRVHHAHRLLAIAELEGDGEQLRHHKHHRNRIEQSFGHLTNLPFGLWALPNFVRRLHRVSLWTKAKITLYHLHLVRALSVALAA